MKPTPVSLAPARVAGVAAMLLLFLAGCQTNPVPNRRPVANRPAISGKQSVQPESSIDALAATDPCASRMHDIGGDLLFYYLINKKLPEQLDQLKDFADVDRDPNFTCPVSHKPYVYFPAGFTIPGQTRRLILFDADPVHGGKRWGIVMAEPEGKHPAATWVIPIDDQLFRSYTGDALQK
jgi:hypothetical protein